MKLKQSKFLQYMSIVSQTSTMQNDRNGECHNVIIITILFLSDERDKYGKSVKDGTYSFNELQEQGKSQRDQAESSTKWIWFWCLQLPKDAAKYSVDVFLNRLEHFVLLRQKSPHRICKFANLLWDHQKLYGLGEKGEEKKKRKTITGKLLTSYKIGK